MEYIAQRGTSHTTASGYTLEGIWTTIVQVHFNYSSTDVPSGQGFASSMKLDCTTGYIWIKRSN